MGGAIAEMVKRLRYAASKQTRLRYAASKQTRACPNLAPTRELHEHGKY
jgi:hypothetical protein